MAKLTVGTYNIWHGEYVKEDVGTIGRALAAEGASLVGLQEVDQFTSRMNGLDTLRIIAEAGQYPYFAFSRAMEFSGGEYGTAVLSRYPILSFRAIPLSSSGVEPRSVGHAVIDVDGTQVNFFNTHISVESHEARVPQLAELKALTGACERVIMTGDFNTEDLEVLATLSPLQTVNQKAFGSYYPKNWAIDHIFLSEEFSASGVRMPSLPYSDHNPIFADVEF